MCVCVCACIYIYIYIYIYIVSGVLTVEMGVLTVKKKLIQVDMLRLESKGLRADVPHERERCRSFWKG